MVVANASRSCVANPTTRGECSKPSQSGSRPTHVGGYREPYGGGGELVAHSSVDAPQGLGPMISPFLREISTLMMKTTTLLAMIKPPQVASRFKPAHPIPGG